MKIQFAAGESGKLIPLQRVRSTYWIGDDGVARQIATEENGEVYVSPGRRARAPQRSRRAIKARHARHGREGKEEQP
jgi:hypothetical protein